MTMRKLLSALGLWLIYVPLAHAQDLGAGQLSDIGDKASIKGADLPTVIGNLIRVAIGLLGVIFLVLTVYAGFLYLTASGDEEKVTHAKETLKRGVIGIVIISAAYAIATFVIGALTATTSATST